jgi:hypothetical protein
LRIDSRGRGTELRVLDKLTRNRVAGVRQLASMSNWLFYQTAMPRMAQKRPDPALHSDSLSQREAVPLGNIRPLPRHPRHGS